MLIFLLPTKKCLVVSYWDTFQIQYLGNHSKLEKAKAPKNFVDTELSF